MNQVVTFGRTDAANVVLDQDRLLSSRHFEISGADGKFSLRDLGSTNGTRVNGQPVESCELAEGDQIAVGTTLFVVRAENSSENPINPDPSEVSSVFDPFGSVYAGVKKPKPAKTGKTLTAGSLPPDENEDGSITQVRLRIISGVETGSVNWLGPGQSLVFGRTAKADCVFGFDRHLSGRHFRVTCEPRHCIIEDLESRAGTWLNGKKITKSTLYDGDKLVVGTTKFEVELRGLSGRVPRPDSQTEVPVELSPPTTQHPLVAIESDCAEGTPFRHLLGSFPAEVDPSEVLGQWSGLGSIFLILDFSRLPLPFPKTLDVQASSLFHWLPEVAAKEFPVAFSCDELPDWPNYVNEAWGSDAVLALQSTLDKKQLVSRLRNALGDPSAVETSGILGFCWPSVLASILKNNTQDFANEFDFVRLVWLESQDEDQAWQAFVQEQLLPECDKIGLQIKEPAEPEESDVVSAIET